MRPNEVPRFFKPILDMFEGTVPDDPYKTTDGEIVKKFRRLKLADVCYLAAKPQTKCPVRSSVKPAHAGM